MLAIRLASGMPSTQQISNMQIVIARFSNISRNAQRDATCSLAVVAM
jgi:hypothetical protein